MHSVYSVCSAHSHVFSDITANAAISHVNTLPITVDIEVRVVLFCNKYGTLY